MTIQYTGAPPMKFPAKTVRKKYYSITYFGKPFECVYALDAEVDRWMILSCNVPGLNMENDSIKLIEAELPELVPDMEAHVKSRTGA